MVLLYNTLYKKVMNIKENIIGALLAFIGGGGIAAINYMLSCYLIKKHPEQYAISSFLRQILLLGYLLILFFFGKYTPWDPFWLLLGGGLGLLLPSFYFTYKLVKLNDSINARKEEDSNG